MIFWMLALVYRVVGDQHHIGPFARQDGKRAVQIVGGARLDGGERRVPAPGAASAELFEDHHHWKRCRDSRATRFAHADGMIALIELQPLRRKVRRQDGVAGDVAAGAGEALHQAGAAPDRRPRSSRSGSSTSLPWRRGSPACHRSRSDRPGAAPVRPPPPVSRSGLPSAVRVSKAMVWPIDISGLAQPIPERLPDRSVVDDADARDFPRPLLCAGGERRTAAAPAKKRNQFAPLHLIALEAGQ